MDGNELAKKVMNNMIRHDPMEEVKYRAKLAVGFLKDALKLFQIGDWRGVVANSQLAVENAAKAIIAIFREPSWSHDPSHELLEVKNRFPHQYWGIIDEIARIVHELAPEHGRSTYGEPSLGLTPWDLYKKEDAERVLKLAKKVVEEMKIILKEVIGLSIDTN